MSKIQICNEEKIDLLSSKARQQATELNNTLDELNALGVYATVSPSHGGFLGHPDILRVRLSLTQPNHQSICNAKGENE